jgi:hypothetical protein
MNISWELNIDPKEIFSLNPMIRFISTYFLDSSKVKVDFNCSDSR